MEYLLPQRKTNCTKAWKFVNQRLEYQPENACESNVFYLNKVEISNVTILFQRMK